MDWQELVSNSLIAFLFAAMVTKLISLILTFRQGNFRVEHQHSLLEPAANELVNPNSSFDSDEFDESATPEVERPQDSLRETDRCITAVTTHAPLDMEEEEAPPVSVAGVTETIEPSSLEAEHSTSSDFRGGQELDRKIEPARVTEDVESCMTEGDTHEEEIKERADREARITDADHESDSVLSEGDDWEGVESSELEQDFAAAASYVEAAASDQSFRVSNDLKLKLYGLYKQATEGPCKIAAPPAYKLSARAKWQEWQKLGDRLSSEEAMRQYITLLSSLRPNWHESTVQGDKKAGCNAEETGQGSASKTAFGPVFSVLLESEGTAEPGNLEEIHRHARNGDIGRIKQLLDSGSSLEETDSDGRTALHWAVDSGHFEVIKYLLSRGALLNSKDIEGQTALHYAAICEREEIAKYLIEKGADPSIHDNDGLTPSMSCPGGWTWMPSGS